MEQKFKKEQKNPLNNEWMQTGIAMITEEQAELLSNSNTRYIKDAKAKRVVKK